MAELRYYAYGGTRYTYGTTPTAYRFTGQRLDNSVGLYYYGARYYDPALGRFIQADTIVPQPANPYEERRVAGQLRMGIRYCPAVRRSCCRPPFGRCIPSEVEGLRTGPSAGSGQAWAARA